MGRLVVTALAALVGYGIGWVGGIVTHLPYPPDRYPFLAEQVPLPHHIPKDPGGLSFRFAMAHDVLYQRFPKHGPAYYAERNRLTRERLAALDPDDPARFPLLDDLAAGLERLGHSAEAAEIIREKLDRQQAAGVTGRDLYTSYANLGTFLIHSSFGPAIAGDPAARARFEEGIGLIRQAIEVNPEAHFGREQWQASIAEFLRAAMDDPSLLTTYDCLGNRLDLGIEPLLNRDLNWTESGYGRPNDAEFGREVASSLPTVYTEGPLDEPSRWPELKQYRRHITKIGAEPGWEDVPVPSHRQPVPFDEPMLGIIGMWRQGGGANPHFALAIGETMLRVGQRYIAWSAFERASRMADRYWPDPAIREALRDHCRARQEQIEATFRFRDEDRPGRPPWQRVSPPPTEETVAALRSTFDRELAHGEGYQHAFQEYERERIEAGVPITAEDFDAPFFAGREPIASPTGQEEWFAGIPTAKVEAYSARQGQAWGVFGAGVGAMGAALLIRLRASIRARRRRRNDGASAASTTLDDPMLDPEGRQL